MDNFDISSYTITEIIYFIRIGLLKGDVVNIKDRPRTGMVFAPSGRIFYSYNGKSFVSDQNHVLILPEGGTYDLTCEKDSICPMVDFRISPPLEKPEIYSFNITNIRNILNIYNHIDNLWTFRKSSYKLKCMAGLYEIFAALNDSDSALYCPKYKYEQIMPSIDYLEANYSDPDITNELLAQRSGISTVYFRKIFTEKYGMSPMKYLHMKRIEKARDMLLSEFNTITGISEATGFNSIYNFSRAFRNVTGLAPTEYIREHASRNLPAAGRIVMAVKTHSVAGRSS